VRRPTQGGERQRREGALPQGRARHVRPQRDGVNDWPTGRPRGPRTGALLVGWAVRPTPPWNAAWANGGGRDGRPVWPSLALGHVLPPNFLFFLRPCRAASRVRGRSYARVGRQKGKKAWIRRG